MKPKKLKKQHEELNMWQPTSDLMSALMYILMLVVLLLGLYMLQNQVDPFPGDETEYEGWTEDGGVSPTPSVTPTPTHDWDDDGDGDGGGWHNEGGWPSPTPTWTPTLSPTPTVTPTWRPAGGGGGGHGPEEDPGEGFKSAVYVKLVDEETLRTVKIADVQFELYAYDGALQILNTYYPERISYRSFLTREDGTFYLPEKLMAGLYELHQITEPEGYDAAPNQLFDLADLYDWPDPYVVEVPVSPSRNIIRVQQTDARTGMPVAGGSYDVISINDVITADGTLRYHAGETVSSILCNEKGYGESEQIFLGEYRVVQKEIPPFYASQTDDFTVTVSKKAAIAAPLNTVACQRTRITLNLADELYTDRSIAGVTYTISSSRVDDLPVDYVTDSLGRIVLDELEKGVTYRIVQKNTVDSYRIDADVHTVDVTAQGRIGQEAETTLDLTNRMLRVSLGITDEFSSVQVPGIRLALYNDREELITSWTTTGAALTLDTLAEGRYFFVRENEDGTEERHPITVRNAKDIQTFNIHTTYVMQYVLLGTGALALIGGGTALGVFLRRRKKAKST